MTANKQMTMLVPLDGSPEAARAVEYARTLLPPDGALVLLRVVPDPGGIATRRGVPASVAQALSSATNEAQEHLESIAGSFPAAGPQVRTVVTVGDPADTIIETGNTEQVDLIVMTTHGRGAGGRAIFGSVADRVTRHGTRPTLLLRGAVSGTEDVTPAPPERIVVPLDGSALAEQALPAAAKLAGRLGIPLRLVRVVAIDEILNEVARARQSDDRLVMPDDEAYTAAQARCKASADGYLAEQAEPLRAAGIAVDQQVLGGSPAFVLLDRLEPGDLAVMTTHGRGGVRRWLLGSVAEKLVRNAACPVMLVPAVQPPASN
jgi:nucleotide-binding universal stress UspA family protein